MYKTSPVTLAVAAAPICTSVVVKVRIRGDEYHVAGDKDSAVSNLGVAVAARVLVDGDGPYSIIEKIRTDRLG
jgi:hypothetical protein